MNDSTGLPRATKGHSDLVRPGAADPVSLVPIKGRLRRVTAGARRRQTLGLCLPIAPVGPDGATS
jgi:hypothetical protein